MGRTVTPVISDHILKRARTRSPQLISSANLGTRKVSLPILLASPKSPSTTSLLEVDEMLDKHIEIPVELYSPQSYQFMGFTKERALDLFERFENGYDDSLDEGGFFLDIAVGFLSYDTTNAHDDGNDWIAAMNVMGIDHELREAIMTPEYRDIRLTKDLISWLVESIEINFESLDSMNLIIEKSLDKLEADPTLSHLREGADTVIDPLVPQGHSRLYKSFFVRRIDGAGIENSVFDLSRILSPPRSDFASTRCALYFTPQKWLAVRYAEYARKNVRIADVRTIEVHIPDIHFEEATRLDLAYGDEWRKLIFYSRKGMYYPDDVRKYYSRQEIITGPIAHNYNDGFAKMEDWGRVTDKHMLLSSEGEVGIQYVWIKERSWLRLQDEIKGKYYLH